MKGPTESPEAGVSVPEINRLNSGTETQAIFPSPAGMPVTKLSLVGKYNLSQPGRVWLVTSRLGTGKSFTFFTAYKHYTMELVTVQYIH
jgi:hypothetical protein